MIAAAAAAGPVVIVDAGSSLAHPTSGALDPARAAKADVVAASMMLVHTDAVVLSALDWSLGREEVLALVQRHQLPVLAANLSCDGATPFPASMVIERGGKRIGLVGVTDGRVDGCTTGALRPALEAAVAGLGPVDITIALLPTDAARTKELFAEPLAVDLIFDADVGRIGPEGQQPAHGLAVGTGARGQRVGLTSLAWRGGGVGWVSDRTVEQRGATVTRLEGLTRSLTARLEEVDEASRPRLREQVERVHADLEAARAEVATAEQAIARANRLTTRVVELDTSLSDHPETLALVSAFLDRSRPTEVLADTAPRVGSGGAAWAGSDSCKSCHPGEHAQWQTTPHARAWAALVEDRHDGDDDCFACHSTGARQLGGPNHAAEVSGLRDVQCEACHGPARQHMADPAGVRPKRVLDTSACVTCHDGERDGGRFDPAIYLPKVQHQPAAK